MALLKRRVLDPARFVFFEDDAIDHEHKETDYEAYLAGFCDWEHLRIREGAKPTVFVLRQLTHRERLAYDRYSPGLDQLCFAVRCGLVNVENYAYEEADGSVTHVEKPVRKKDGALKLVTEQWLADARLTENEIGVMATAIMGITEISVPLLTGLAAASGAAKS